MYHSSRYRNTQDPKRPSYMQNRFVMRLTQRLVGDETVHRIYVGLLHSTQP